MHPAYSVIFFTVASGAGYGLLFWLSVASLAGGLPASRWLPVVAMAIALVLITAGLLASTFHLGHPERAWRAFSQWRSSWLSREGVAAVATYIPSGLLGLIWLTGFDAAWTWPLALLSGIGAVATIWCTGMIYASLATIRQWHLALVPVNYLALAAASGAALLALVLAAGGVGGLIPAALLLVTLGLAALMKLAYFRRIDGDRGRYTIEMATGLEGPVRQLDPPHTMPNFVMREMGYRVARRHAWRLRRIALICLFLLPAVFALAVALTGLPAPILFLAAALFMGVGLLIERWLFFAEAEHVAMLYYGKERA